ncbi:MAG: hypothetical protein R3A13_00055 [Bdellovibrionota bacterium]
MLKKLFYIICLGFSINCFAEDSELSNPKDFYDSGFVNKPIERDRDVNSNPPISPSLEHSESIEKDFTISTETSEKDVFAEGAGKPVKSLGVVVLGTKKDHLNETLEHLRNMAVKLEIQIGEIITLGGMHEEVDGRLFGAAVIMGAKLRIAHNVNDAYEVTQSPTWVVETEEGITLLEGIYKINKFFNRKKEFVDQS